MAVLALQSQALHMMFVAERNRLFRPLALPGDPWRALQLVQRNTESDHKKPRQNQAHTSQSIGAAIEYLRHECFPALFSFVLIPRDECRVYGHIPRGDFWF
jgi:hypothetical protein